MKLKRNWREMNKSDNARHKGQGLVEFALILPVLLLTLFVIIELARVLHAWMAIENGARFGVRYAVTGEYDPALCTDGGVCGTDLAKKEARVESIKNAAIAGSASVLRDLQNNTDVTISGFFKVTVCPFGLLDEPQTPTQSFGCNTSDGKDEPGNPGDDVMVVVEFTHPLITPFLTSIVPNLHLNSEREATVETFRVVQAGEGAPESDPPPPDPPVEPPEPPPPSDPCENIIIWGPRLDDRSKEHPDRMWKLSFHLYNNNSFDGTISWFKLDWDRPADLDLTRWVYRYVGQSSPRLNFGGQKSGPLQKSNLPFPSRPQLGMPSMYGEFCVDMNSSFCKDDDDYLENAQIIPAGDYTFTIKGTFDFGEYGTCPLDRSFTGRATPKTGGGGGGGGDPFDPPDIPPGGDDPPPGGGGGGPDD